MGASIYHVVRFSEILTPPPLVVKHGHLANPPIKPRGHSRNPPPSNLAQFFQVFLHFFVIFMWRYVHNHTKYSACNCSNEERIHATIFWSEIKKFSPPDHVVISETLPLPLVVIHGHFMNPPSPLLWPRGIWMPPKESFFEETCFIINICRHRFMKKNC